MKLALFDIDGTLIPKPGTEPRFARRLLRQGKVGPRQVMDWLGFTVVHLPRYRRQVFQKNKAWLAGLPVHEITHAAEIFVREELDALLIKPTVERLRRHQEDGDYVVLLSGTPQFIADPLARHLGAHEAYGALCPEKDGCFTAGPLLRHPFGPAKVDVAREIAGEVGVSLTDAVAYGDSLSDNHLLRAVGSSVVVMPHGRMRRVAGAEGWEIITG